MFPNLPYIWSALQTWLAGFTSSGPDTHNGTVALNGVTTIGTNGSVLFTTGGTFTPPISGFTNPLGAIGVPAIYLPIPNQSWTSTTTTTPVTGLSFSVVSGQAYMIKINLVGTSASTGGFRFQFTGLGGATAASSGMQANLSGFPSGSSSIAGGGVTGLGNTFGTANNLATMTIDAYVLATGSGTITLYAAQETSNSTASTIYNGAMTIIRVQ